ncbi:MAG: hypothetical protein IKZ88_03765 [Neisseriaceae bacterium]|nr:hypothetical protein [Neisseriaceae bacterium]
MKTQKFALSVMAVSLMAAVSSVQAADTDSPFAIPMHLSDTQLIVDQDLIRTGQDFFTQQRTDDISQPVTLAIKPNVMLLIDDSGSMWNNGMFQGSNGQWYATRPNNINSTWYSRAVMVRDSLLEVLDSTNTAASVDSSLGRKPTYAESARWGLYWMNNKDDDGFSDFNTKNSSVFRITDTSVNQVKENVRAITSASANTPLASSYIRATQKLADNIDYRCRKNYLVFFGDGYPEGNVYGPKAKNASSIWKDFKNADNNNYYYRSDRLWWLGDYLHNRDLKTARDGTDDAGKPWDAKPFVDQKITTFVISGWARGKDGNNNEYHSVNMKKMATPDLLDKDNNTIETSFEITDPSALKSAFSSIFKAIETQQDTATPGTPKRTPSGSTNTSSNERTPTPGYGLGLRQASYSPSNPNVTGSMGEIIPNEVASVYLHPTLRSSELRFFDVDETLEDQSIEAWKEGAIKGLALDPNIATKPSYDDRVFFFSYKDQDTIKTEWADLTAGVTAINNSTFGLPDEDKSNNEHNLYEWQRALIPWLARRVKRAPFNDFTDDVIAKMGYQPNYRIREENGLYGNEREMGDVMNADVVSIGDLGQNSRAEFLITQANDGMAYIFMRSDKANNPYDLKINFTPMDMPRSSPTDTLAKHLKDIANEAYIDAEHPHLYMMDGGVVAQGMHFGTVDSPDHVVYTVGNLGRGGRGVYALRLKEVHESGNKVSNYVDNGGNKNGMYLFEKSANTDKVHEDLGYTVPKSAIGRINATKMKNDDDSQWDSNIHLATFVASGYAFPNKGDQETALYIYETIGNDAGLKANGSNLSGGVQPGDLIKKIVIGKTGGLSDPTLLDVNLDGIIDYVYAGDYSGNMYRFDVRDMNNIPEPVKIFEGNASRPITSAPAIAKHDSGNYVVVFGTGTDLYEKDYESKAPQAVYGIYQFFDHTKDMDAADRDKITKGLVVDDADGTNKRLLTQTLKNVNITDASGRSNYRYVSNNEINDNEGKLAYAGWKLLLDSDNGERVVVKPGVVLNSVEVLTRWYDIGELSDDTSQDGFPLPPDNATPEQLAEWEAKVSSNGWVLMDRGNKTITSDYQCAEEAPGGIPVYEGDKVVRYEPETTDEERDGWKQYEKDKDGSVAPTGPVYTSDPCEVVNTGKDVYNRACSLDWTITDKYQRKTSSQNRAYSALIQLSSYNGGAIFDNQVRKKGLAFLDFVPGQYSSSDGYIASMQFDGILSLTLTGGIYLNTKDGKGQDVASNTTEAGDSGGTGWLIGLGQTNNPPSTKLSCGTGYGWSATGVAVTTTGQSGLLQFQSARPMCGVKRISWREIF